MGMLQGSLFTAIALFASPFQKTSVYTYYIVITTGFPGAPGAEGSIQHPMRTGGLLRGQLQRWRIYRRADDPVGGGAGAGPDRGHPGGIGRAKADGGLRRQGAAGGAYFFNIPIANDTAFHRNCAVLFLANIVPAYFFFEMCPTGRRLQRGRLGGGLPGKAVPPRRGSQRPRRRSTAHA